MPYLKSRLWLAIATTCLLLAGCESTLPEFRRFEVATDAKTILILDRHGLYLLEDEGTNGIGPLVLQNKKQPMHPPHASGPMPRWLDDFDRNTYLHLERGIITQPPNDWGYELVFAPSPLPPAYPLYPRSSPNPWPDPMDPKEVTSHASNHKADTVITLDFIEVYVSTVTNAGPPSNLDPDFQGINNLADTFLNINLRCGFRSYDGNTGLPIDQAIFAFSNNREWNSNTTAPNAATIEYLKAGLPGGALEAIMQQANQALIAQNLQIH